MDSDQLYQFRETVWDYFHSHQRTMPWREDSSPYHVLVSELMLQQTQVGRVLPKYEQFMRLFPTIRSLADAPLVAVLKTWNGLGYNRRAKFLHAAADIVQREYGGVIPNTVESLSELPGVGKNTAGAIVAYAYNLPTVFIETNIRTVFFHHFFADAADIADKDLLALVEQTCDLEHPREWYWALMDYGTHLKQTLGNNISRSKHYVRQSKFEGSRRQLRGQIIKRLLLGPVELTDFEKQISDERLTSVVDDLIREGMILRAEDQLRLTGQPKLP